MREQALGQAARGASDERAARRGHRASLHRGFITRDSGVIGSGVRVSIPSRWLETTTRLPLYAYYS
jgi:hypothetical protein